MGGRKYTGPSSLLSKPPKAKNTKRKKQRSLNALAIAEKIDPERTKIRRHRLGESEPDGARKRKREAVQEDESDGSDKEEGARNNSRVKRKTNRGSAQGKEVDYGSDSEGNRWMLGGVASDEDSSIDSDEAMGASDEEKYADFVFRGGSSTGRKRKAAKARSLGEDPRSVHLSEGGEDTAEEDDFGEEGVDLATRLDECTDDEGVEESGSNAGSVGNEEALPGESSEDEESAFSFSDDEKDAQDSARLASLRSLVTAMNAEDEAQAPKRKVPNINESTAPSEYGLSSKQKLTVADLLPSVKDPQLKKSLRILADNDTRSSSKRTGIARKLDVPLPKRQQDRLDRAAAYEKSKETLNRWIDTVKHNRRAEHLSFPLQDPDAINAQGKNNLDRHAKPLTDLEATIQNILQDSGLAPVNGKSEEEQIQAFEELEANKMPLEEVQARHAELRRARDLLFREEIRAKRIKKIKSKSYRRIHRKERERLVQKDKEALAAAGVEDSESEKERKDRRRAEERMGAKHRESRWAKGVKESGRMAWDEDARAGVEEMARREEDLKRRILGKDIGDSDGETSSEDDDEGKDDEGGEEKISRTLQDRLQRLDEDEDQLEAGVKNTTSALSSMKFMRNAEAAQKASNDQAVQQMQRELAGEETPSEEEPEDGPGRRLYGPNQNAIQSTKPRTAEQRSEFEERQSSGDEAEEPTQEGEEELQIIVDGTDFIMPAERSTHKEDSLAGPQRKRGFEPSSSQLEEKAAENPWLSGGKAKFQRRDRGLQDSGGTVIISNELLDTVSRTAPVRSQVNPSGGLSRVNEKTQTPSAPAESTPAADDDASDEDAEEAEEQSATPFVLRNQDLVRKAFAGDDVVANFEKEKEETMQSEDEKVIDNTLAGWGTWVGAGIGKRAQKRSKNRFLTKQEGIPKAKRQDAKLEKVIINEKRVKKNAKYLASQLPHPFETRQQYERSLRLPVGPEWTTKETFQAATKPRVLMKQGIITPMAKPII
ncbi:MAG: hypothetical protein LQ338_002371 [Usnochroma carphineum]|nr:MAG: hypothetical protein LQ338_002371 [Usnochroma carphineum]